MLSLRVSVPGRLTDEVLGVLRDAEAVSGLGVVRGASLVPAGDVVTTDVAREGANSVMEALRDLGVHEEGTLRVEAVDTWLSQRAYRTEKEAPGASADAVVWAEVTQRAYEEPELAPIAAIGPALVRRRSHLLRLATRTLVLGFAAAIGVTFLVALLARWVGWLADDELVHGRTRTAFIDHPDHWNLVVAIVAASAGVLSLTSGRTSSLAGVYISVTTVPAAGNIALGLAVGARRGGVAGCGPAGPQPRGDGARRLAHPAPPAGRVVTGTGAPAADDRTPAGVRRAATERATGIEPA